MVRKDNLEAGENSSLKEVKKKFSKYNGGDYSVFLEALREMKKELNRISEKYEFVTDEEKETLDAELDELNELLGNETNAEVDKVRSMITDLKDDLHWESQPFQLDEEKVGPLNDEEKLGVFEKDIRHGYKPLNKVKSIPEELVPYLMEPLQSGHITEIKLQAKEVDAKIAELIAESKIQKVEFINLDSISDEALLALSQNESLLKLTFSCSSMSDEQMEIILNSKLCDKEVGSSEQYGRLSFIGLKSITDRQAELLSAKGIFINLSGIESLTDRQTELLSQCKGHLMLDGLQLISDNQAKNFSDFKGLSLSLNGLKRISNKQSRYFRAFAGAELYMQSVELSNPQFYNLIGCENDIWLPEKYLIRM